MQRLEVVGAARTVSGVLLGFMIFTTLSVVSALNVYAQHGGDATGGDASSSGFTGDCHACTIILAPSGGDATGGAATGGPTLGEPSSPQLAAVQITSVRQEHNVWQNGYKGMIIHVSFNSQGLQGKTLHVAAFFNTASGQPLRASPVFYPNLYSNIENQVKVSAEVNIQYASATIPDVRLFMPYAGLNMAPSQTHYLKFNVGIAQFTPGPHLADSPWLPFQYTAV